jgi:hypothetical protein
MNNRLIHFQQYKRWYEVLIIVAYFLINNSILATSVIMEAKRGSDALPFDLWEPFVWEYSSAILSALLIVPIVYLLKRFPMNWQRISKTLSIYFIASFAYSLIHVVGMVGIRKLVYFSQNRTYDFGNIAFEMFYEYRKDLWSFVFVIVAINCYHFVVSRLLGEANLLDKNEEDASAVTPDRLLVRKLGKEFLIKVNDIEYLESAGNYVNLHSKGRIYPTRNTMNKLIEKLSIQGFCRVHRSYAVNLDEINSMTPQPSGDSDIVMTSGKTIPLSRRYKEALRQHLHV